MYRYIAFVWNPHNVVAASRAACFGNTLRRSQRRWAELINLDGMWVFSQTTQHPSIKTYTLPGNAGVILGRLFPTDAGIWSATWEPNFGNPESITPYCDSGESFRRKFWGGYIALFRNQMGTHCRVIRDCSGKIPCYQTEQDSVHIFFSDISDIHAELARHFDIDWSCLATFIYSRDTQTRRTTLIGVTELLAGDAVEVKENSIRQYSDWDPRAIVKSRSVEEYDEAKDLIRATTQFCVEAWASVYESVTLRLSGGLDSAVVLGSLMRAPSRPAIVCTHQFSNNPCDDERSYARLAANAARIPLIELPRAADGEQLDTTLTMGQMLPRPSIQAMFGAADLTALAAIATEFNAEASWTGQGGDHLFFQAHSSLGAADYISNRGLSFGFVKTVLDSANISREPYLSVLCSAWKLGRSRVPWTSEEVPSRQNQKAPFLNPDALPRDLHSYMAQPWAANATDIPKGKQFQMSMLADVLNRHRPTPVNEPVDEHHPLISQPLIELCLQIPTYLLLRGGRQRALARDAFADRVPREILLREDKGVTTAHVMDTIRRSESFISQLLLDGLLVRHHLISAAELEPYIVQGQSIHVDHVWPLLSCIAAELWARRWSRS